MQALNLDQKAVFGDPAADTWSNHSQGEVGVGLFGDPAADTWSKHGHNEVGVGPFGDAHVYEFMGCRVPRVIEQLFHVDY
jgi:hypothetical protein